MMKKLILGLVTSFLLFGFGGVYAQEWTWSDPALVTSAFMKEIVVNPVTGDKYGVDIDGNLVLNVTTATVTGLEIPPTSGLESVVNDIATAFTGSVFICTEINIKEKQGDLFVALTRQPRLPEQPGDPPGDILQGKYTHIAVGDGGKLYVLYQVDGTEDQYLMIGTPPITSEGVIVDVHPETLNLGSKGNWVTCIIDLPEGADENNILLETVKISRIEIPSLSVDEVVDIPVAPGAPWSVETVDGIQVMKVKFRRYDKTDPGNAQSLIGKLRELLTAADAAPGRYQVTLTVEAQIESLQIFSGTDDIRIKLNHKLH